MWHRSKEAEAVGLSTADSLKEVRIQTAVVEFLLTNVDVLFSDSFTSVGRFGTGTSWSSVIPADGFHYGQVSDMCSIQELIL